MRSFVYFLSAVLVAVTLVICIGVARADAKKQQVQPDVVPVQIVTDGGSIPVEGSVSASVPGLAEALAAIETAIEELELTPPSGGPFVAQEVFWVVSDLAGTHPGSDIAISVREIQGVREGHVASITTPHAYLLVTRASGTYTVTVDGLWETWRDRLVADRAGMMRDWR